MRTELIEPCVNELPKEVTCETIDKIFKHMLDEVNEVTDALEKWKAERNGKNITHLAEEFVDVATNCATALEALECLPETDKVANFADSVLLMVNTKNYARGYHNSSEV